MGSFCGGSLFVRTLALHSLSISALPLTVYLSAVQWFFWVVFFLSFLNRRRQGNPSDISDMPQSPVWKWCVVR